MSFGCDPEAILGSIKENGFADENGGQGKRRGGIPICGWGVRSSRISSSVKVQVK
jgi:hypothetical protein